MKLILKALFPILALLIGAGVMVFLIHTRPRAATRPPKSLATLVRVMPVEPMDRPIIVSGMGVVSASHSIKVLPQVSGKVLMVNPMLVPGGILKKGDVLVRIDDRDYKAVVATRKAAIQQARYNLMAEEGHGRVAKKEWAMLKDNVRVSKSDKSLVLRKPQLEMMHAALQSAKSGLRVAMLNVARTVIRAPFDALVMDKSVDIGQVVGPGRVMATLIDMRAFWVQVVVPVDELKWIDLPDKAMKNGARARVIQQGAGVHIMRKGRVIRLLGDLEPKGRMARLLVEVTDPLVTGEKYPDIPLLIGSYVKVNLQGHTLKDVFVLPGKALRDNNRVYVMTKKHTLSIRKVKIMRREDANVLVRGDLHAGDRVVVSRLDVAVQGMKLRTPEGLDLKTKKAKDNKGIVR